ncbi:hypothetical protein [Pseudomonas citronellolis]|uniref:hypothetical protein n=1 Tax=Pseudomonas citronellolis TaxID=53408 RepID=UPI0023E44B01|nr:hypothetical protein [Pseudomonas citronellolis]MDF3933355.1 hypothetical protein [Pseudomonas citronellolis]
MHQTFLQARRTLEAALGDFAADCSLDQLDGTLSVRLRAGEIAITIWGIASAKWVGAQACARLAEEILQYLDGLDHAALPERRSAA